MLDFLIVLMVVCLRQCGSTEFDYLSNSRPHLEKKGTAVLLKILDTQREGMRI